MNRTTEILIGLLTLIALALPVLSCGYGSALRPLDQVEGRGQVVVSDGVKYLVIEPNEKYPQGARLELVPGTTGDPAKMTIASPEKLYHGDVIRYGTIKTDPNTLGGWFGYHWEWA